MKRPEEIDIGARERRWGAGLKGIPSEGCPEAEDLLAFSEGELQGKRYVHVIQHLGHCAGCRDVVKQLRIAEAAAPSQSRSWFAAFLGLGKPERLAHVRSHFPGAGAKVALGALVLCSMVSLGAVITTRVRSRFFHSAPVVATKDSGTVKRGIGSSTPNNAAFAASLASDRRLYCMIGENHAFLLDSPNAALRGRMDVEQQFADRVSSDQSVYQNHIASGADPSQESDRLRADLAEASAERDQKLANLCSNDDALLVAHPELRLDCAGPYQLVQVDYHLSGNAMVFDGYELLPAWPGYERLFPAPFGWAYHHPYPVGEFERVHQAWSAHFAAADRPAFYGLAGHAGAVNVNPAAFVRRNQPRGGYTASTKPAPVAPNPVRPEHRSIASHVVIRPSRVSHQGEAKTTTAVGRVARATGQGSGNSTNSKGSPAAAGPGIGRVAKGAPTGAPRANGKPSGVASSPRVASSDPSGGDKTPTDKQGEPPKSGYAQSDKPGNRGYGRSDQVAGADRDASRQAPGSERSRGATGGYGHHDASLGPDQTGSRGGYGPPPGRSYASGGLAGASHGGYGSGRTSPTGSASPSRYGYGHSSGGYGNPNRSPSGGYGDRPATGGYGQPHGLSTGGYGRAGQTSTGGYARPRTSPSTGSHPTGTSRTSGGHGH